MKCREVFNRHFVWLVWQEVSFYAEHFSRLILISVLIFQMYGFSIVPTESMYPTIHPKDFIIFEKHFQKIERGDIVVFRFDDEWLVKRVVAVEGDVVSIQGGTLFLNDAPLKEHYVNELPFYEMERQVVPDGHVFVLGDNRNASVDSSSFGPISKKQIKGKVKAIVLPFERTQLIQTVE